LTLSGAQLAQRMPDGHARKASLAALHALPAQHEASQALLKLSGTRGGLALPLGRTSSLPALVTFVGSWGSTQRTAVAAAIAPAVAATA
jgi:hypothetical protein